MSASRSYQGLMAAAVWSGRAAGNPPENRAGGPLLSSRVFAGEADSGLFLFANQRNSGKELVDNREDFR